MEASGVGAIDLTLGSIPGVRSPVLLAVYDLLICCVWAKVAMLCLLIVGACLALTYLTLFNRG